MGVGFRACGDAAGQPIFLAVSALSF